MIKFSKLFPKPLTIKSFKFNWLKEEFMSYSDDDIKQLMKDILKSDKKHTSVNGALGILTFKK